MGYTTSAGLQKRDDPTIIAGLCTDGDAEPDITNATTLVIINQAIADADSTIDSHVLGHLDMTEGVNTAAVERLSATIALYLIYSRKHPMDEDNGWYGRYRQAIRELEGFAKRKLHTSVDPLRAAGVVSINSTADKTFTNDALELF